MNFFSLLIAHYLLLFFIMIVCYRDLPNTTISLGPVYQIKKPSAFIWYTTVHRNMIYQAAHTVKKEEEKTVPCETCYHGIRTDNVLFKPF